MLNGKDMTIHLIRHCKMSEYSGKDMTINLIRHCINE